MKARYLLMGLAILAPAAIQAQQTPTVTTVRTFTAILSPSKEVPAVTAKASGTATIELIIFRDAADTSRILSAIVDFRVNSNFETAEEATGLHIHRGGEGVAGPVVINTGLTAANLTAGANTGFWQAQVNSEAGITAVTQLMANPGNYYVNLHTKTNPSGIIRGQLSANSQENSNALDALTSRSSVLETLLRQIQFRLGLN